jgi:hypothetical protein
LPVHGQSFAIIKFVFFRHESIWRQSFFIYFHGGEVSLRISFFIRTWAERTQQNIRDTGGKACPY